jgi:uncharacterized protein
MSPQVAPLLLASLLAIALPSAAQVSLPRGPLGIGDTATIETSASREVRIAPDRATLVLSIETRAPSAGVAAQNNARAQRGVLDTLRAIGIAPSQIGTAGYTVQPNYEPGPGGRGMERNGFVATNSITVLLTQLERVGAVIDAALARGATNAGNLTFDASNTADARRAALADAAVQAKSEATTLAKALGGTLGPLIFATTRVNEPRPPGPMPYMARASAGAAETPIEAGEISVEASVIARWAFVPNP